MNEKENTARMLANNTLLVTSPWCRFGWHRWTIWSKSFNDGPHATYQDSFCACCNERRVRRVEPE